MKAFKIMGLGPRKSKSGFTLIELLIVMVIIAILAGVIVMAVGGVFGTARSTAYSTAREQIQNAVTAYSANTSNAGLTPTAGAATAGWISNNLSGSQSVVDVNKLLVANGGMLRTVPDGIYTTGSNAATPYAGLTNLNTTIPTGYTGGHYLWLMDQYGTVASVCINTSTGNPCTNTVGVNGYLNTWP